MPPKSETAITPNKTEEPKGLFQRVGAFFGLGASSGETVKAQVSPGVAAPADEVDEAAAKARAATAEETYARNEKRYQELKDYQPKAFGTMESIDVGTLVGGIAGASVSSFWDPGSIQFGQWLWNRRSDVLRFHQSIFIGSPYEDGEKLASIAGGLRVIDQMVQNKGINDETAGMLVHELMVGATGQVVGRDSWWKRMIGAAVLSQNAPVEHVVEEQHVVAKVGQAVEVAKLELQKAPERVHEEVAALLEKYAPGVKISDFTREADAARLAQGGAAQGGSAQEKEALAQQAPAHPAPQLAPTTSIALPPRTPVAQHPAPNAPGEHRKNQRA